MAKDVVGNADAVETEDAVMTFASVELPTVAIFWVEAVFVSPGTEVIVETEGVPSVVPT